MKRYQESNWIVKVWRRRHYVYIPFKWCMYYIRCYLHNDNGEFNGKTLWHILIGVAQCDMKWTYTQEEIEESIKQKYRR